MFITAHSGADGTPDNSLAFVRYALETQADAFEVDVRRTDAGLTLSHDAAGEGAPLLSEAMALAAAHPSIKINCDLKEPGLERETARLAETFGLAGRLIFSGTVDADVFADDPALSRCAEVYLNLEEYVPGLYWGWRDDPDFELRAADTIGKVCARSGIRTVNVYQGLVTRRFLERLRRDGLGVSAWTVDGPDEQEWFFRRDVYNMTTRRVAQALARRQKGDAGCLTP